MTPNKKLLIISCSGGSGHIRAAEALELSCKKLYPDTEVRNIDLATFLNKFAYLYVVSSYNFSSNFIPILYRTAYHLSDSWLTQKLFKITLPLTSLLAKRFFKYIKDYQPDLIISTHYLPQLILPKDFSIPIDTIITDYYPHKVWLTPKVRNTFVATEEIKNTLEKIGIKSIASGIPIHPDFLINKNREEIKNKLGIKNTWPIILLLPTTREKIEPADIINGILNYNQNKEINIVVITNKNDLKKLHAIKHASLLVMEKVDNIDEWMRIADIIISKAGGLTITEAMYLQKPIIVINPIPGQEDYNTDYLEQNHYGVKARSAKDVALKIQNILENPTSINKKSYSDASKIILGKIFS